MRYFGSDLIVLPGDQLADRMRPVPEAPAPSDFDWQRDGDALLRDRKSAYFGRPPRPSVSPMSERLAPYVGRK